MKSHESAQAALIVGIDSQIGSHLAEYLTALGWTVYGTSRHKSKKPMVFYVDLSDIEASPALPSVDVAFLCAAETSHINCTQDPQESEKINVASPFLLARQLIADGAFVVFLSSNAVFDGKTSFRREDEPVSPQTTYGQQKARAEQRLLELGGRIAICRLAKVVIPGLPLLAGWRKSLACGEVIRPFSDMVVAPVFIDIVRQSLTRIADVQCGGIFHLSGSRDVTYAELASYVAERMGVSDTLVCPIPSKEAIGSSSPVPLHSTLDCTRLVEMFGISPPDPFRVIDMVFELH